MPAESLPEIHMKKPGGKNPHRGSTFESFLAEEGHILTGAEAVYAA